MNPFLEKMASQEEYKKSAPVKETIGAYLGYKGVRAAPSKILGYHTVYHGTTKENAANIKRKGFDPSRGGTGAATVSERFVENSKNKVHFTKSKLQAGAYAGGIADHIKNLPFGGSIGSAYKNAHKDYRAGKGEVLKAKIPHSMWEKMEIDRDSSGAVPDEAFMKSHIENHLKNRAATYDKKVNPSFVEGGRNYAGRKRFASMKNLKSYLGTSSGRNRALTGVAQAVGGAALAGFSVKHNADNGGILSKLKRKEND